MATPIPEMVRAIQQVLTRRDVPYRTPRGHAYTVYSIELAGRVVNVNLIDAETGAYSTAWDLARPELVSIYRTACPEARP